MGRPKALVHADDGTSWLRRASSLLERSGCQPVIVVLGARAEEARALLDREVVVVARDWQTGLSASLRAGLEAAAETDATAALITLVDLPNLPLAVADRVLERLGVTAEVIGRAVYDGQPGHPVLLGRTHWEQVCASITADDGARDYLRSAGAVLVECGDLGGGDDIDS